MTGRDTCAMKPVYAQWLGAQSPLAENQAAHSGADQDMLRVLNRVDSGAAQLAHRFVDVVDAVNIGFAQQAAVGVDGQLAADLDVALGDKIPGLAAAAKTEL